MRNPEEAARRLLDSIAESLNVEPGKLARVAGQFITPSGNQVYQVQIGDRTTYVTVPEDIPEWSPMAMPGLPPGGKVK